jgi:hypothetical protein
VESTKQITANEDLISYCGFYCGACPNFKKMNVPVVKAIIQNVQRVIKLVKSGLVVLQMAIQLVPIAKKRTQ